MLGVLDEAEEYELFGYPHTEVQDCNFLEDVFAAFGRKIHDILDIACGTGRHALEMAERGYTVTGIDISEKRLRIAMKKAADQSLQLKFVKRDMIDLDFKEEFDAAYILFNTMSFITRNEDLIKFMNGAYRSLRANGLFVVEVGNLWSYIAEGNFSNISSKRDEEKAGIKRHLDVRTIIGPYNNIFCHRSNIRYWRNGEELQPKKSIENKRAFSVNEFDLLCRLTKFRMLGVFGSTDINKKIENPHMIKEIEKPYRSFVFVLKKKSVKTNRVRYTSELDTASFESSKIK